MEVAKKRLTDWFTQADKGVRKAYGFFKRPYPKKPWAHKM